MYPSARSFTFLFSDIEGSTRLWEQHPEAMSEDLARHDELVHEAAAMFGGRVFKTVGDAFCCVFGSACGALQAAEAAQRALRRADWRVPGGIRVRMAAHTGPAEERDADYFGPTLNRVARLLAAGHGGQVLLSASTRDAIGDELPPGCTLRDMGERYLKDLARPERVFQVLAEGLPAEFPPLNTLDARPNNLPVQPTPLIGREAEVRAATELLRKVDVQVVTMTGAGGSGKTRLALQVAAELIDDFTAGVFFVPLATITDPGLVLPTVAQHLNVREVTGRTISDALTEHLHDGEMLLVLDNFEQVLAAATDVAELAERCPQLKLLVTSRFSLRLRAEHEFPVAPLAHPDPRSLPSLEDMAAYPAVALFLARASALEPGFALTRENRGALAEICARLDGLPLAIELAAARIKVLTPQAMLVRLEHALDLLAGGPRDLPERQRTLRQTIDWSYRLLDEDEQKLFRRLSVFSGGFTLDAAEALCAGASSGEPDVLDGIGSLVDKSFIRVDQREGPEARFHMLETLREYGLEAMAASGEERGVRAAHAKFFAALAEEAAPQLEEEEGQIWLDRLAADHDNLRAALRWLGETRDTEDALNLASTLSLFWFMRGYLAEARDRLTQLLALPGAAARTSSRAGALNRAGFVVRFQGDYDLARRLMNESLAIYRELRDTKGTVDVLANLGDLALYQGSLEETESTHKEALEINRALKNRQGVADSLSHLGMAAYFRGDYDAARALHEESLAIWRELGDQQGVAWALHKLGSVLVKRGEYEKASSLLWESLELCQKLAYHFGTAWTLEGLARVEVLAGRLEQGVVLAGAAESLRREIGAPTPVLWERELLEALAPARDKLGDDVYERAWNQGQSLTPEEAISDLPQGS